MVGFEPVTVTALSMAVIFIETCRQVCAAEIVPAVCLCKRLYLPTRDTAKTTVRHTITKPDEKGKLLVEDLKAKLDKEFSLFIRLLLYCYPRFIKQR